MMCSCIHLTQNMARASSVLSNNTQIIALFFLYLKHDSDIHSVVALLSANGIDKN